MDVETHSCELCGEVYVSLRAAMLCEEACARDDRDTMRRQSASTRTREAAK